ncbi:TadE/TadG family type IV pilus assembly protein [Parafrankia sp. BMG5.11]|uniref:TadE/TadG family type IV pilus assembly protein n=1 Tax=Parafrankia sp. BMG5.11 TaxID=222540 RepID=UPI00103E3CD2|nr:TadE/TadG family type IV pilus assembly protein [Parafrankia sp. BMG5.11]TCJ39499.1 pilus assembly protein [Parafrankia sp. BMG5.11]
MMPHDISSFARFCCDETAAAAAEFALVVPIFLGLIFATINGSIMMSAVTQMHYAAERAARCLSVDVGGACTPGGIDAYAKGFYNGPALTGMSFTPTSGVACGNRVQGAGTYELISGLEFTSVPISSEACYPKI